MIIWVKKALPVWNSVLLISSIFAVFILPVISVDIQKGLFRIVYSIIYITAVFSLNRRSNYIFGLFLITILLEWVSGIFDMPILNETAKTTNVLFFLVVVFSLIWQIAAAKNVNTEVILGSIIGYLMLGLTYSIFVSYIMQHDPASFNQRLPVDADGNPVPDGSIPLYFSFVTLATLGYGDIVPVKPYTRSLATWIAISGQFYIAIIVALLVGKFLTKPIEKRFREEE